MDIYTFQHNRAYNPPAATIEIEIRGIGQRDAHVKLNALVDSGSDGTLIPIDLLRQVQARRTGQTRVRGFLTETQAVNIYWIELRIRNIILSPVYVVGVQGLDEALIGRDVLNHLIVTLHGPAQVTEVSQ